MDPSLVEAFVLAHLEHALTDERDKKRLMEDRLRAAKADLIAKETERSTLLRERDELLAMKEAERKLVSDFIEADINNDFEGQRAMVDAFVTIHGKAINYVENAQNLDA